MAGRRRKELDVRAMVDAYLDGEGPDSIGQRHGVTGQTVRNRLSEAGVPLRPQGSPKELPMDRIADEYLKSDVSLAALAAEHGVHWMTIRRRLERRGVQLRKRDAGRA